MNNELSFGSHPHTKYLFYIPQQYHHCTLESFQLVEDRDTQLIQTVKGFIEGTVKGVYLYGSFGLGKTHILVSLYRVMVSQADGDIGEVWFTSLEKAITELQSRMNPPQHDRWEERGPTVNDYIEFLSNVKLLFLDDITAVNLSNAWTVDVLRKIINGRYEKDLRTCFTSNASLQELLTVGLHPHSISRIAEMCKVVKFQGRDWRLKDTMKGDSK